MGATGYGGAGVASILLAHPVAHLVHVASDTYVGQPLGEACPWLRGTTDLVCAPQDAEAAAALADIVVLAGSKGKAMEWAPPILEAGKRVLDLSGDFRLKSAHLYEEWYGIPHTAPFLCLEAAYGIPELASESIARARLVANPGCYPTGAILALFPLLQGGLIEPDGLVIDAKSGVSGAGRGSHGLSYHFPELNESVTAYKIGVHQHTPEIEQALSAAAGHEVTVTFVPHLIPVTRGILTTVYARPANSASASECAEALRAYYAGRRFVRVLAHGAMPTTKATCGSNYCDINTFEDARAGRLVVVSAIDNLGRGAATQAVQNLNLMLGLDEGLGIPVTPVFP